MRRRMSGPSLSLPPGDGGSSCESDGDKEPKDGDGDGVGTREVPSDGGGGGCEAGRARGSADEGGHAGAGAAGRQRWRGGCPRHDSALCAHHHVSLRYNTMLRAADVVVHHDILSMLCSQLLAIEYIDVTKQVSKMCWPSDRIFQSEISREN
ncbi:hypothetical protein SETIT_1G342300v2 [Setaria italica]|uniref:Uncharacterized protein n=1 Tax=Setaria italica TaxID=4555 RepID=A0A368PT00_SETIT|nr:hypothetical protein SETIT_1G342300v2 [Setaria italica]